MSTPDDSIADLMGFMVQHGLTVDHLPALQELAKTALAAGLAQGRAEVDRLKAALEAQRDERHAIEDLLGLRAGYIHGSLIDEVRHAITSDAAGYERGRAEERERIRSEVTRLRDRLADVVDQARTSSAQWVSYEWLIANRYDEYLEPSARLTPPEPSPCPRCNGTGTDPSRYPLQGCACDP